MAAAKIPMSRAPLTFRANNTPDTIKPKRAIQMVCSPMLPRVIMVASLFTIRPAFCIPIKAINKPIPAEMACFRFMGMALTISSRTLKAVRSKKMMPSRNTAVSANCQLCPMANTTVKAKKAFKPIPGARAKGNLAQSAITRVATTAESAVAVNTAFLSMPVTNKISGLTARM